MALNFQAELTKLLAQVPPGRITTFKVLAEALGDVRAAKAVYQVLREERLPGWHRVIRSDGSLPFDEAAPQLEAEGVPVHQWRVRDHAGLVFMDFESGKPLQALRREQEALARRVLTTDELESLERVAGFDVSYARQEAFAAAVLVEVPGLSVVQDVRIRLRATFPYISTYLAYREFEPIAVCYEQLDPKPSLLLVDGNGILHPARFGIACLVGVKLGAPTIGVAKKLLMGTLEGQLSKRGDAVPVLIEDQKVGYAYWPTGGGRPIYVSPGHRVSPETALELVCKLCVSRLPEPLKLADRICRKMRQEADDRPSL